MAPTYESFKYCPCGATADYECTGLGCDHEDHPRFTCDECYEKFEAEEEAMTNHERFANDMKLAGYKVNGDYHGRWFYEGPAIVVEKEELQSAIRATKVNLQWDEMGKSGLVVYPA